VGFWSFGADRVEFCSRVVDVKTREGVPLRAKVTVHLRQPSSRRDAEEAAEHWAGVATTALEAHPTGQPLDERALTGTLMARSDVKRALRRIEVTGLHVVGDAAISSVRRGH
jgi:hypothetical protein